MERVRKICFDPLLSTKEQIRQRLESLPVGTAHPFGPERILLCHAEDGIQEIDISTYPEEFFYNAVDLGEMGEILLQRMAKFSSTLGTSGGFHRRLSQLHCSQKFTYFEL